MSNKDEQRDFPFAIICAVCAVFCTVYLFAAIIANMIPCGC